MPKFEKKNYFEKNLIYNFVFFWRLFSLSKVNKIVRFKLLYEHEIYSKYVFILKKQSLKIWWAMLKYFRKKSEKTRGVHLTTPGHSRV